MIERPVNEAFISLNKIQDKLKSMMITASDSWSHIQAPAISECWGNNVDADFHLVEEKVFNILEDFDELEILVDRLDNCFVSFVMQKNYGITLDI